MEEIIRTNDMVLISFIEALFKDANIEYFVAETNVSVLEGSIGILPRRILVRTDDVAQARRLVRDADLESELRPAKK